MTRKKEAEEVEVTTLQEWVEEYGLGAKQFLADETARRWATIHDIVEKRSVPQVDTAKAIERATGGRVPWQSLV